MRPSERLRQAAATEWDALQHCRFVLDIQHDHLPCAVYARYLHFERGFVETAMIIFGHAMLQAPTMAARRALCTILHGLAGTQLDYFDRSLAALDVPAPPRPAAVDRFCRTTRQVAETSQYPAIMAMMLAAEWAYATWCVRAHAGPISDALIADWVRLHAEADFLGQVAWLRTEVDAALAADPTAERTAAGVFASMLRLELDFHDAAYPD